MTNETLLILNPASRGGRTGRDERRLRERLEARLGPVRIETTRAAGDAERIAAGACAAGVSRLLIGGGDGTASEAAAGLLRARPDERPTLGLLPLGSGGDWGRALGVPRDLDAALEVVAAGHSRAVDAGRIEYRDAAGAPRQGHFVNEASAGLSGATVRMVGRSSKRLGPRLGFVVGAVAAILSHRPVAVAVEIDGERIYEGPVSMVVAANGGYFGAGMRVAPGARPDDGRLEVLVVRGMSMPRLLANLPSFYVGRHLRHPKVSIHGARTLSLIPKEAGLPIDVDGESLGVLPMRAEVLPGALRVFAPPESAP